jgi:hypothetical protein
MQTINQKENDMGEDSKEKKIKALQLGGYSYPYHTYRVGDSDVISIEWFSINGEMASVPCFRITYKNGSIREIRTGDWIVDYE